MLMDAPPDKEAILPFITMTHHLRGLNIRCPEIYSSDISTGFVLLEDLGDNTFTRLLIDGKDESALYRQAIGLLVRLHDQAGATDIELSRYDFHHFINEALLFTDWYLPCAASEPTAATVRDDYIAAWSTIFHNLPELEDTLVLRDYHVDNLMQANSSCAVLDYQDALIGSPAYDVVSLLEDARRNISTSIRKAMLESYFSCRSHIDRKAFTHHLAVWGAQRHTKVAGIFTRLSLRDNKPHYRQHIPRTLQYLKSCMQHESLSPLVNWIKYCNFSWW